MQVNANEDQMVGNAVNDAAFTAFPAGQSCQLPVCIVEGIRANMEHHPPNVDAEIAVEIEVSGNNSETASQEAHGRRSHLQLREKLGEAETYWPVKMKIQNSLDFSRFESRFDPGN